MKAMRIQKFGGPEVLAYEDVETRGPSPHEVGIRIEAIGVNFVDTYYRTGAYPAELPLTPGVEAAGVVDAVGSEVSALRVGDRVAYAMQMGAYADYAVVPADKVVVIPDNVSTELAAAVLLQGMTAHVLANDIHTFEPGQTALVHAAAGGVGALLAQMLKRLGVHVYGTVSNDDKAAIARKAGVDEVILYTRENFADAIARLTHDVGVNAVFDSVGKDTWEGSMRSLRRRGSMVFSGQSSGKVPPIDPQLLRTYGSISLHRPTLSDYIAERSELEERASTIFSWVGNGELDVRIDQTLPLAEAAAAHERLEGRTTSGKVILIP